MSAAWTRRNAGYSYDLQRALEDRKERPADITVGGPRTMAGLTAMSQTVAYIRAFQGSSVVWLLHILEWLALILRKHQERQHFWFWKVFGISERGRGGDTVAGWFQKNVSMLVPLSFQIEPNWNRWILWHWEGIEVHKPVIISIHIVMGKKVNIKHFLL